jgi:glycosyltransferase involved in cell wall biosynthesis
MRILVLHSRYLSGSASGENRVVEDEVRILQEGGHEVERWTPSPTEVRGVAVVRTGLSAVRSRVAAARVRELVDVHRPEIVHLHNLFPMLSPSVVEAAQERGAAVVMTLHNYRMMCLPGTLLRDGRICEDCVGKVPWRGVMHRCYRGSALGSGTLAASLGIHRVIKTFDPISLYLAISRFVMDKHVEAGFPVDSIRVKRHFAWPSTRRVGAGRYFLYIGRVAPEKGVETIVRAWQPHLGELRVVGNGPEVNRLKAIAPANVRFLETVPPEAVPEIIAGARAVLAPSLCYEGAGKVVLEAYACGVPALASRIGGLPEVLEEGTSGFLLPPRDGEAWVRAAERLLDDREAERLGRGAFEEWREHHGPDRALVELESSYKEAIDIMRSR